MSGFPPTLFAGRRFVVAGLGRAGLPAARALAAMGADIRVWDDDRAAREAAGLPIADPTAPLAAEALILSPGIPHTLPAPHPMAARAREQGVPILSDTEMLFRAVRAAGSRARFAGITGTNGKSTTTALLAHMLERAQVPVAAGGNLGRGALDLPLLGDDGVYVLEMSSYMLERIATLRFDVAAMLNLTPDHLDRHGDMAGYAAAKRAIFARQGAEDCAVVAIDDENGRNLAQAMASGPARLVRVTGGAGPADWYAENGWLRNADGPIADLSAAPALPGTHNAQNAAVAGAMATALGVPASAIAGAIASYPGLAHRQQRVAIVDGIAFVNDSKATNADAAAPALSCYERLIWIAGGVAKAGGIASLAPYFPRIAKAFLIGRDGADFAATLAAAGVAHENVATLDRAVPAAFAAARQMGVPVVLLSPAAASFDQFGGFEARGAHFAALANRLAVGAC